MGCHGALYMQVLAAAADTARKAWSFVVGTGGPAHEALARVLEDNFDGHVIVGEDGRIIAASHVAASMLLGAGPGTLTGRQASGVLPGPVFAAVSKAFADGRRSVPSPMSPAVIGDPDHGGHVIQFVVTLSDLGSHGGVTRRVVSVTFWDETDRRRREQEIAFIGGHDPLTGAITRAELTRSIQAALDSERQRSTGLTLVVLDINRFKELNSVLGQRTGDRLLKQVVGRLKSCSVESVARIGNDSFGVIKEGTASDDEAREICRDIHERITRPYALDGHDAMIGVSMGVTHTAISGFDADNLVSDAESAQRKSAGTPGTPFVCFTSEMDRRLNEQRAMDVALRTALELGQLTMTYQPQCSLEDETLLGVEALVRWAHPTLGVIPPERFLPAAEQNGQIVEIGRWLLKTACSDAATWPFQARVAVNVSPEMFEFCDVAAEVRQALAASRLPAHRLDIEIPERAFASGSAAIEATLLELRRTGVGIVLDHFGAGYSSLGNLGRLPVDKIKIDRRFVSGLPSDTEAGAVIRAVMMLSETLGKLVTAEGVDTRDQAWMLRLAGCRVGQGYYFGRPRGSDKMSEWHGNPSVPPGRAQTG